MKKLFIVLVVGLFPVWAGANSGSYADFVFQKQIITNGVHGKSTCQAFFIHKNWLATSAHCVETCLDGACSIEVLLAQGDVNASARWFRQSDVPVSALERQGIFIPKDYRTVDKDKRVRTHKAWDIALLHYQPEEFAYEFAEGGQATQGEFEQARAKDPNLQAQWEGATRPKIPVLYTYSGPELMNLKQNLTVPLWDAGEVSVFSDPETVLYFGENASLWAADGFGVDHGNSGGAVMVPGGGVVGVATAKMNNNLPADVRRAFPTFGQAADFFLFTGFAPKTTLKFIQNTMLKFGDRPRTKKLKRVHPIIEP